MAPLGPLIHISDVVSLLLQRPVHYVVVVAKPAPVEPWYASAEAEELLQRGLPPGPQTASLEELQRSGGDYQDQLKLEELLEHLKPADGAQQRAVSHGGLSPGRSLSFWLCILQAAISYG